MGNMEEKDLLPEVKGENIVRFIRSFVDGDLAISEELQRINIDNEKVYDFIEGIVSNYNNEKLARLCAVGTYILLEQSGEIPLVEEETLQLFFSEVKEPGYGLKQIVEIQDHNPNLFNFFACIDIRVSPREPVLYAGINVYGLLKTQAKKNFFNKIEKDKQLGLEYKVVN